MGDTKPRLKLSSEPDGYGFIYGDVTLSDLHHQVNVMPPASQWRGDIKLEGYEPHETDRVLFLDGQVTRNTHVNAKTWCRSYQKRCSKGSVKPVIRSPAFSLDQPMLEWILGPDYPAISAFGVMKAMEW